jgi:hypothetical protein
MIHSNRNSKDSADPRTKSTSAIWGYATGMFALCIPLVGITRIATVIPFAIALGAGAGTVAVWRSDRSTKQRSENEQYLRLLEERIANLETIASHSELDIQQQFKPLESQNRLE